MNPHLSEEAVEVGVVLRESIDAAGGVDLLRRAIADPSARSAAEKVLDDVGLWDLDPARDRLELEIAATSCHAAGRVALPYPIVERLGAPTGEAVLLAPTTGPCLAAHVDLDLNWSAVDLAGARYEVLSHGPLLRTRLAPFSADVRLRGSGASDPDRAALITTLQAWWVLGLLERAFEDTVQYSREREQFGRAIIHFQGVGFQLADMTVEVEGLRELAKYTLWAVGTRAGGLVDAVGLRVAALRAADVVLGAAHQVHGAMGFTSEVDVSWLSLASQMPRRTPAGRHATAGIFADLVDEAGWSEFGHAAHSDDADQTARAVVS